MKSTFKNCVFVLALTCFGGVVALVQAEEPPVEKITFEDHIKPIFREHCMGCHNAGDKSSGLALDTYGATLEGGSGGKIVAEGNVDGSRLYALMAHTAQPFMPPDQDRLPDANLELVKKWIEQGMPENSGSTIKKPKANLGMLSKVSMGRPEGPLPMPVSALKQTPLYTPRSSAISAIAASPWSPLVAIGGQEQVCLYHTETGELLGILPFPEGEPQSIRFSRDGQLVLVGGGRHSHSGYAVLYNIATGERITRIGDELDIVMAADISDDNSKVALAGPQKMVRVYSTSTGDLLYEMKKHTDWIYALRFSPDGVLLASADRSNGMVVWEADTGRLYLDLVGHKGEIRSIAWRPDSGVLVSGSLDGTIKFWEMNEGKLIKSIDAHGGVNAVDICNDGTMASTGRDAKVRIWDAAGNPIGEMPGMSDVGLETAITVDGKFLIGGDWSGNVLMWERANPANQKPLAANPPTLEMTLQAIESSLPTLQQEANAHQATYVASQTQLDQAQMKLKASDESLVQVNSQIGAVATEVGTLKTEVDTQTKRIAELEAMLAEAKRIQAEKATLLAAAEAKSQSLTAQKAQLEKEKADATAVLPTLTEAATKGKATADAATAKLTQATAQLEKVKADLANFVAYRQRLSEKTSALQMDIETVTKQLAEVQSTATQSQTDAAKMDTTLQELQNQLTELQRRLTEEQAKRSELTQAISSKEQAMKELQTKLEQLQGEAALATEQKATFEKSFPNR